MATIYLVQTSSDDGGEVGGVFSTHEKAKKWIENQSCGEWHVVLAEIDRPVERDDPKIIANLEAKGHSFIHDPHQRCVHCGVLIGLLKELEEKAKLSDLNVKAPSCQPGRTHESTKR